jgi:hypothetical protein
LVSSGQGLRFVENYLPRRHGGHGVFGFYRVFSVPPWLIRYGMTWV